MAKTITIRQPDDWHLHLRDDEMLNSVAWHTFQQCRRAVIMPNLKPPITNVKMATAYRDKILSAHGMPKDADPLMVLYITADMREKDVQEFAEKYPNGSLKLYPAGATTNSELGVQSFQQAYRPIEWAAKYDLNVCIHGEKTGDDIDIFDQEARFVEDEVAPIVEIGARVVLEHITTKEAVDFVEAQPADMVHAGITVQHPWCNRNAMLKGGIKPHYYCLPISKREEHRLAVRNAMTSGDPHFSTGPDSAPHLARDKLCDCGCAGCYTAPYAIAMTTQMFDEDGCLNNLEAFLSENGAKFRGLPLNDDKIILVKKPQKIAPGFFVGGDVLVPFEAGKTIEWSVDGFNPAHMMTVT